MLKSSIGIFFLTITIVFVVIDQSSTIKDAAFNELIMADWNKRALYHGRPDHRYFSGGGYNDRNYQQHQSYDSGYDSGPSLLLKLFLAAIFLPLGIAAALAILFPLLTFFSGISRSLFFPYYLYPNGTTIGNSSIFGFPNFGVQDYLNQSQ